MADALHSDDSDRDAGSHRATSDAEAGLLFAYDKPAGFGSRYVENHGRYWLASYIVPLALGLAAVLLRLVALHERWALATRGTPVLFLSVLLGCSLVAVVLALVSLLRREMNSYYALQTFICGFLVFIFATAWSFM